MKKRALDIEGSLRLVETSYDEVICKEIAIEYIEHATDYWGSDTLVSINIDATKAREIIVFLQDAFGEEAQHAGS